MLTDNIPRMISCEIHHEHFNDTWLRYSEGKYDQPATVTTKDFSWITTYHKKCSYYLATFKVISIVLPRVLIVNTHQHVYIICTYVTCHNSYLMKSPLQFSVYHTYKPSRVASGS